MKRTTVSIAALAASNLIVAGLLIHQHFAPRPELRVDHLAELRLAVASDGLLHARLGDSLTQASAELAFTPRAALQLHAELGRMFALIEKQAAEVSKAQPVTPRSGDRSL